MADSGLSQEMFGRFSSANVDLRFKNLGSSENII